MKYPYTVTNNSLTIFINGDVHTIPSTHYGFVKILELLGQEDPKMEEILAHLDGEQGLSNLSEGRVSVVGNTIYFDGVPVHTTLATKIIETISAGLEPKPLMRFMDNVEKNPDERARNDLFDFLARWDSPITDDGCFVAFKGVNADYSSTRADPIRGVVYNIPGSVVSMPREECDHDPDMTCSSGLHVCASYYLDSFWRSNQVIAVKVNPKDVVAIPTDYRYSKMRVCEYFVMGDIKDKRQRDEVESATYVSTNDDGEIITDKYDTDTLAAIDEALSALKELAESGQTCDAEDFLNSITGTDDDVCQYDSELEGNDEEEDCPDVDMRTLSDIFGEIFLHTSTGRTFDTATIVEHVEKYGQREAARKLGIPRSTLQGWWYRITGE